MDYKTPEYLHFPVATTNNGKKLSKQNLSPEITIDSETSMLQMLINALTFLGQEPPALNEFSNLDDLWQWAIALWDSNAIPKTMNIVYTDD